MKGTEFKRGIEYHKMTYNPIFFSSKETIDNHTPMDEGDSAINQIANVVSVSSEGVGKFR